MPYTPVSFVFCFFFLIGVSSIIHYAIKFEMPKISSSDRYIYVTSLLMIKTTLYYAKKYI